jgi:hypothetical protein
MACYGDSFTFVASSGIPYDSQDCIEKLSLKIIKILIFLGDDVCFLGGRNLIFNPLNHSDDTCVTSFKVKKTLGFTHAVYLIASYDSQKKRKIFLQIALIGSSL